MRAVHVRVTGIVQGVGYRAWAEHAARARGLDGWVRNRRDGSVEAVIAGEDAVVAGQWPTALRRYAETDRGEILTVLTEVASQCGTSLAAAALAWVVSKPGVAAAIVAVNSPAELAQACAATSCRLSADQIAVLDAVGTSSINL